LLAAFAGQEIASSSGKRRPTPEPMDDAMLQVQKANDKNRPHRQSKDNLIIAAPKIVPNSIYAHNQLASLRAGDLMYSYAPGPVLEDQKSQQSFVSGSSLSRSPSPALAQILLPPELMMSKDECPKPKRLRTESEQRISFLIFRYLLSSNKSDFVFFLLEPNQTKTAKVAIPMPPPPPPPSSLTAPFSNSLAVTLQPSQHHMAAFLDVNHPLAPSKVPLSVPVIKPVVKSEDDAMQIGGSLVGGVDIEAALALAELSRAYLV
jgi:hypothetical protein